MLLNDIYQNIVVEDQQIECKSRLDRNNTLAWLKTVDAFANTKGGIFFIGVEDKTNKLIGFEQSEIDGEKLYFFHTLEQHFDIMPDINSEIIPYKYRNSIRYILKINVLESETKPIILMFQKMPCVFKRRDGYTSAATTEELIQMSLNGNPVQYDTVKTNIKFDINDFKKLSQLYEEHVGSVLTEKILGSISFYDENKNLYKGSLLFKDDYDGTDSSVVCSIYEGITRGDNKVLASNSFKGNLIDCLTYMYNFVIVHMNKGFIKKDTYRIDLDAFPRRSIFESLVNALAHRDYFIHNSDIFVDLFKNKLVITSPGSMFKNDEVRTTYQLDKMLSCRRNQQISSVFALCKVMEIKGTGFEKILDDYKDTDENHKPFIRSTSNQFSITLPDLTYPDGVSIEEDAIAIIGTIENQSKYDIKILAYCYSDYKNVKEIAVHLGISNSTFLRKSVLENLVNQGYLTLREVGREKQYLANHDLISKF